MRSFPHVFVPTTAGRVFTEVCAKCELNFNARPPRSRDYGFKLLRRLLSECIFDVCPLLRARACPLNREKRIFNSELPALKMIESRECKISHYMPSGVIKI